ncbi:S1 family peptidase [Aliiglaciecola sp. 3_MG-2023]|uniref:S1 family peptidase n=1 Tax=Aliiglaciecola sp. 3_MG-2023 TaxID=3062644 RepID=UPI0026E13EA8|nr:S1 family peptidase [Aliiglaciecola sp. 3_MG-2023]MDO6695083.1 S1 family peptidase [Aliiglaciecola sp. 3_MG-2023]
MLALVIVSMTSVSATDSKPHWWYRLHVSNQPTCVAVAVEEHWLITPWHCVQLPGQFQTFEKKTLFVKGVDGKSIKIKKVITPYNRYRHLGDIQGRDIALLQLNTKLEKWLPLSQHVKRLKAPLTVALIDSQRVHFLKITPLQIENKLILTSNITCKGDSGVPLIDEHHTLVAIASWHSGRRCNETGNISFFNRVDIFSSWIHNQIGNPVN